MTEALKGLIYNFPQNVSSLFGDNAKKILTLKEKWSGLIGEYTFNDIVTELKKPGRDPRDPFKVFQFREDIFELGDLKEGMICNGIVSNVTNFGAFVDIGLPDSGLVHVSRLSNKFVSDPHDVVSVGDVIHVWVIDVDMKRRRVSLTAIKPGTEAERPNRKPRKNDRPEGDRPVGRGRGQGQKRRESGKGKAGKGRRHQSGWKPKAKPKPVVPITDAMAEGKEPMRTFSDLLQFHNRKKSDGGNEK